MHQIIICVLTNVQLLLNYTEFGVAGWPELPTIAPLTTEEKVESRVKEKEDKLRAAAYWVGHDCFCTNGISILQKLQDLACKFIMYTMYVQVTSHPLNAFCLAFIYDWPLWKMLSALSFYENKTL